MSETLIVSTVDSVPYFLQSNNSIAIVSDPETWIINETPDIPVNLFAESLNGYISINFTSNNEDFTGISIGKIGVEKGIHYQDKSSGIYTLVYDNNQGWINQNYRTITFERSTSGDLRTWLESNAIRQIPDYLCFTSAKANSSITLNKVGSPSWTGFYSTDADTWTEYIPGTTGAIALTNIGDKVYFRGEYSAQNTSNQYLKFSMSGKILSSGNIMSLCSGKKFANKDTIPYIYMFYCLFFACTSLITPPTLPATTLTSCCYEQLFCGCTSLTTAPMLPATTSANYCYSQMFSGCTSLTTVPSLPATTLKKYCYTNMFNGCKLITNAPELPAITLAEGCYQGMFSGCTSLTTAPTLPATKVYGGSYSYMFNGCTSLTNAPTLPATELNGKSYAYMFKGCTSLTIPPALPATTLENFCYQYMFQNCTALTAIPALAATTLATACYSNMFNGCSSLYVSDSPEQGYEKPWTIPTSGAFVNTMNQQNMFTGCLGTRASNSMAGAAGMSYTYYTQNTPI